MASYVRAFKGVCQECEKPFSLAERFCTVVNLDTKGFEKDRRNYSWSYYHHLNANWCGTWRVQW